MFTKSTIPNCTTWPSYSHCSFQIFLALPWGWGWGGNQEGPTLEGVVWLQADSSQVTALTRRPMTQQSHPRQRGSPGGWWTPGSPPPSSAQRSCCPQSPRDVWDPAGAEQAPSTASSLVPSTRTCLSVGTAESGGRLAPVPRADLAQGLWGQRPGRARGAVPSQASASLITLLRPPWAPWDVLTCTQELGT